jgi:MFS family permease
MMALVVDFSPPTHLGRSYGWYTMALYTSMSLGPAVGGYAAQSQGFIFVFLVSGTIILLTLFGLVFFLPNSGLILPHSSKEEDRSAIAREFLKNRPLLGCWLATLGGCFGLGMFITFLPLHARNMRLSIGQIGLLFLVQGLCNALSRIPFGHLSDKVTSRANLVLIGSIGLSASTAGLGISRNLAQFVLFAVFLGVSMGLGFTSVGALIAEAVPAKSRGLAMGGYNTCIYLGMMLSAGLMGGVIQRIGFAYGFSIAGLVNIFVVGFFYLLIKDFPSRIKPVFLGS